MPSQSIIHSYVEMASFDCLDGIAFVLLQEALREVDMDGNHTIDFFEYMTIANMLLHKTGEGVFKGIKSYVHRRNTKAALKIMYVPKKQCFVLSL